MPSWVDCLTSAAYLNQWACDMGPYIGPWPLLPPAVIDGTGSFQECVFLLAFPNPSDPSDLLIVADGSYDTPVWISFRQNYSGSGLTDGFFGYYGDSTYATGGALPSTQPSGLHLYVIASNDGGSPPPPDFPPEHYVPASYAVGGIAAFETSMGAWSADQISYNIDTVLGGTAGPVYAGPDGTYTGEVAYDETISTVAAMALAAFEAAAVVSNTLGAGNLFRIDGYKIRSLLFGDSQDTRVDLLLGQYTLHYTVNRTLPDYLHALDPLTYDLDYSESPYITPDGSSGPTIDYDAGGPVVSVDSAGVFIGSEYTDDGHGYATGSGTIEVGKLAVADMPADGTTSPIPMGTVVLTQELDGTTADADYPFDLGVVTEDEFYLVVSPKAVIDGALEAGSIAPVTMPLFTGTNSYTFAFSFDGIDTVTQHKATPIWRYWVPGPVVPTTTLGVWRMLDDHFKNLGDGILQIATDGRGWLPVLEGP